MAKLPCPRCHASGVHILETYGSRSCVSCGWMEFNTQVQRPSRPAGFGEDNRKAIAHLTKCGACNSHTRKNNDSGLCVQCKTKVEAWIKSTTRRGLQIPVKYISGDLLIAVNLKLATLSAV